MDMVIQFLGQTAGAGIVFIVLFVVVEYIPILKLFPRAKYIVPVVIGSAFALLPILDQSLRQSASKKLAVILACGLAIWYAIGGIKNGLAKLDRPNGSNTEQSAQGE